MPIKEIGLPLLLLFLFFISGCAATRTLTVQTKAEKTYMAGQYLLYIQQVEKNGIHKNVNSVNQTVSHIENCIKTDRSWSFSLIKYRFELRMYICSLIELGQFDKATKICDQSIYNLNSIKETMLKHYHQKHLADARYNRYSQSQKDEFRHIYDILPRLYLYKGLIFWFTGQRKKSEQYFDIALDLAVNADNHIDNEYEGPNKDAIDSALDATVGKALDILFAAPSYLVDSGPRTKIDVLLEIGNIAYRLHGDYDKALQLFNIATQAVEEINAAHVDVRYFYTIEILKNKIAIYFALGHLKEAQDTLEQYIAITKKPLVRVGKTLFKDSETFRGLISMMYTNGGSLYSLIKEKQKAETYFDEALAIMDKIEPDSSNMIDQFALGNGYVKYGAFFLANQRKYEEALEYINKGICHLEKLLKMNNSKTYYRESILSDVNLESAYLYSAEIYFILCNYDAAVQQANRSLFHSNLHQNDISGARAHTIIGQIKFEQGNIKDAKREFLKALHLIGNKESTENWKLYYYLGKVFEELGDNEGALKYYRMAAEEVEKLWNGRLMNVRKQLSFIGHRLEIFEPLIALLAKQGKHDEVVSYMELSKARTFFDNVLFNQKKQRSDKINLITIDPLRGRQIQRELKDGFAILEFYVGKKSVVGAVITRESIFSKTLAISSDDLKKDIFAYRVVLTGEQPVRGLKGIGLARKPTRRESIDPDEENVGSSLNRLLIKPFEGYLAVGDTVCVVPHGVLHYLPFQAIPIEVQKHGRYTYLINRYKIYYAPSSTIRSAVSRRNTDKISRFLAAGSPPKYKFENPELGTSEKLIYAEQEIQSVSKLFDRKQIYMGTHAKETIIKRDMPHYNTFLFSTHGFLLRSDPVKSFLLFAKDHENDGLLTVEEIEDITINANLVTLSACQSGLVGGYEEMNEREIDTRFPLGDDLVGIQRAILKAGSASVVSTLWNVDDESTMNLIVNFFERYAKRKSKVEALRDAQLTLIDSDKWSHPYYWAPFILSGDWR